jgi:hypothetical protein
MLMRSARPASLQSRFTANDADRIAICSARATSSSAFNCACACSSDAFFSNSSRALGDGVLEHVRLQFQHTRRTQQA